jgi:hypothetical protein
LFNKPEKRFSCRGWGLSKMALSAANDLRFSVPEETFAAFNFFSLTAAKPPPIQAGVQASAKLEVNSTRVPFKGSPMRGNQVYIYIRRCKYGCNQGKNDGSCRN